jgi:ABC-type transport system substrate-binding protein
VVGCASSEPARPRAEEVTLRIGVGDASSATAQAGLRQLAQILSSEGLARIGENGRPEPRLAEGWSVADDGLSMTIRLRPNARFHDGSPVTGEEVTSALNTSLPQFMGPAFEDIAHIVAKTEYDVEIGFRRASPFLTEALELPIHHPTDPSLGTGPFRIVVQTSPNELRANDHYYLGRPTLDRIAVTNYPSLRAAWADLLRDGTDMLYEVSGEALDSLTGAKAISVFTFTRPYQYVIAFNPRSSKLQSPDVRRALNKAIDREVIVRDAMNGHGTISKGPIWPQHWAAPDDLPGFDFDPAAATKSVANLSFKCLVPSGYERIALTVKRQLEAVGVNMELEEASPDRVYQALSASSFEAVFLDMVSGPSLFRAYQWWRSGGSLNQGAFGSAPMDAVLDGIRHAASDDEYRAAVRSFQRAMLDDPPAIFLAWSERARAVNRRFDVAAEPGRDILTTLRLWRPTTDLKFVGRN